MDLRYDAKLIKIINPMMCMCNIIFEKAWYINKFCDTQFLCIRLHLVITHCYHVTVTDNVLTVPAIV